jgi:hypothetical protein
VQIDWAALEYVLAQLSDAQLITPGPEGWAVKDHLAHIGEWENALGAVLRGRPQHEGFRLAGPEPDDIDELNDVLYRRHRDAPMAEVQAFARRAHAEVLDALHQLTDADLQKSVGEFGADPTDERPLLKKIADDSYAHYREHIVWIEELLAAL